MGKIANTWEIMKASWGVLKKDKEILMFPVFSTIASILVTVSFVAPIIASPESFAFMRKDAGSGGQVMSYVYLFLFYVVSYFVIIFFNTGLVACAVKRLRGGDPTVGYGMKEAMSRLPLIFGWAVVAATVGMILRAIEERSAWLGKLVVAILGGLWTLLTFFVVPILVVERKGPIAALKESAELLKKTWGDQIIANLGFGLILFLCAIPGVLVIIGGFAMMSTLGFILVGVGVLYVILLALINASLSSIFQAALYLYAKEGNAGEGFPQDMMERAFVSKVFK